MADPILKHPKVLEEIKRIKEDHSTKTKSLMKSINKLKEDLEKEKYQQQDNVRAKIIERMKKDIEDNETVIEMMRAIINDDDLINKEIVKVLSKGPARARVLSREELRMEIKKLNAEIAALKAGGATKKRSKKSAASVRSEDLALEESFDNIDFDKFKDMKAKQEQLLADLDLANKALDEARAQIEDLKDDKKAGAINLQTLMQKVQDMDADKQLFERVKGKLKDFKREGVFRGIELHVDEEEDDEVINLLLKLNKLLDQTKKEVDQREQDKKQLESLLRQTHEDKNKEVDELVDEYNMKDEEFQSINDKYIALQRDYKKKMFEVAKYKEEMEDAQTLAADLKDEFRTKLKEKRDQIQKFEESLAIKEKRIIELQDEVDGLLQRTPTRSDTSTEYDSHALVKEKKKVAKLTEEIKKLYDIIDRLKIKIRIEQTKTVDQTLTKVRSLSRERASVERATTDKKP